MEILHASIALLASMVLVLAGMVGWLYWQQTRIFQNMNNIVLVISELARPPALPSPPEQTEVVPTTSDAAPVPVAPEEDDRVSVEEESPRAPPAGPVDIVDGSPLDTDDLESKTTKDLKDLLTKRGIPFGKRDSKGVLISLLKATS
jgi:hypothetical protein